MDEINRNSEVRVVIMSSTGKHFCAGMDLDAFSHGVDNIPNDKKPDAARVGEAYLSVKAKELQGYISFYGKNKSTSYCCNSGWMYWRCGRHGNCL